ncbi:dystroglycan-like [Dorcoceras hygrometricum]|uniref:Dystroglycan-like n=1 Tax=Dorcoceras hygrometricum TaxID=472368 RepID=A0A2Z7BJ20_9LAMI|nr:dystroglycan-like [Dorcoceras hygrometricum]
MDPSDPIATGATSMYSPHVQPELNPRRNQPSRHRRRLTGLAAARWRPPPTNHVRRKAARDVSHRRAIDQPPRATSGKDVVQPVSQHATIARPARDLRRDIIAPCTAPGWRMLRPIGYPRMSASGESSTTMHRLLHASGSHPIPPPDDPKTNQYNQDLGLIHSTNGNHLESPNEGSSIDHQVTIYLHAQNITMFPTNETWNSSSFQFTVMASVFITNSYQVNFESVLMIPDNEGMLNMFKALEASGLRGFMGCESVLYEKELEQFFDTALLQDEDVTGAVSGKFFSFSQARFAEIFALPTEGLVTFSDVPKHLVYKARSIFSKSGEQVEIHGKKRFLKYEYRFLNDILAKSITVKAGSYDAVTTERFQMMTAIQFGLKINWSKIVFSVLKEMVDRTQKKAKGYAAQTGVLLKSIPAITMGEGVPFPTSKILSMKTVNTYIATNQTIDARGQTEEQGMASEAIVKRKSKSKKKSVSTDDTPVEVIAEIAGSKKRPATEGAAPIIPNKRRTVKSKASPAKASLTIISVAQEDIAKAVGSKQSAEELMSIDDLLLQISDDMMLPSITAAEITKIRRGESININEVQERDLYYASIPRISMHDKGKEILEEGETVKGNPAREMVELICGDVEFLVRLRDQGMLDVVDLFPYFSLNKLTDLDALRDLKVKEKLMLDWAETDSLETAPWTAMASQIIYLLSDAHSKSLEDLIAHQQEQGIVVEQPSSSLSIVDSGVDGSAVLAQFYSMAKSTCLVRPMVLIDGVWTPIQGTDFWRSSCRLSLFVNKKKQPEVVIEENFVPHVFFIEPIQYWEASPFLIKTWGWARVCTDIVRYQMFGCLRPVSDDVCTDIVVYNLGVERIPASFCSTFAQGVYKDSFVGYFSDSYVQIIPEIDSDSSDGSTVYRSPSPISQEAVSSDHTLQFALGPVIFGTAQEEQSYIVENPESPSPTFRRQDTSDSSTDSPMLFTRDDIPLDATTDDQTSIPTVSIDLSTTLADLQTILFDHIDASQSGILSKLHMIEHGLRDSLRQQEEAFKTLIQGARQESRNIDNVQTLRFNEFRKNVLAQNASVFTGLADVRKEVQEMNAKVDIMSSRLDEVRKDVEATKEAISHQLLEFQSQAQANYIILTDQLGQLVDYINRGGNAKKGEGESSRGPQPPPAVQIRDSGNAGGSGDAMRTTELTQADIDAANRQILERMMREDRERERERRSKSRSGSYKRCRY